MFGLGIGEIIIIGIVAIIFIGPDKLPNVLRNLGKALTEFRRTTNEIKHTVTSEFEKIPKEDIEPFKEMAKDVKSVQHSLNINNVSDKLESTANAIEGIQKNKKKSNSKK